MPVRAFLDSDANLSGADLSYANRFNARQGIS